MILRKKKMCKTCEELKYLFSNGNCQYCDQLLKLADKPFKPLTQTTDGKTGKPFKVYSTIQKKATKSPTVERIQSKAELNRFFDNMEVPLRCENCNKSLRVYSTGAKRCVIAHILPKRDNMFPEVATEPSNVMFLGMGLYSDCNCHSLWDDRNSDDRKKMRCYPLAIKRYESFVSKLSVPQQMKADKYLGL